MSQSITSAPVPLPPAGDGDPAKQFVALLTELENDPTPVEEHQLDYPFANLRSALEQRGAALPEGLQAEEFAFAFWPAGEDESAWGGRFGQTWQEPMLKQVTAKMIDYWRTRAGVTPHPVMRARYADLVWDLSKARRIAGVKPDANMARAAAEAYLDAVDGSRYKDPSSAVEAGRRALDLALQLKDNAMVERARDVLLALDREIALDESPGLWVGFETFIVSPNSNVPLTDAQRDGLVQDMEDRLARFGSAQPHEYHPFGAELAALQLARYYRRLGRKEDVARVLRAYGDIVRRMRGAAKPLIVAHSLTLLYEHFKTFELHADADALNELQRAVGEETLGDMKEISVTQEIPREQIEEHFGELLAGSAPEVLRRIAVHYIPWRDHIENQLKILSQHAPLSFMLPRAIVDHHGRTVAHVGPLDSDLEGNVIARISDNLSLSGPWLREAMRRGFEQGQFSPAVLLEFLFGSPLFTESRRRVLHNGLEAYARGDSIAAIHVLVPQVEEAVRQLGILVGASLYTQRRGGGFHARLLDEFLRDAAVGEVLGDSVITYFRALLTDVRGWNVRNDVAHGLASEGMMQMPIADRVVHALLVLALVRASSTPLAAGAAPESSGHPQ